MSGVWRRRWHRGARALGWTAGVVVIALALLVALAQLAVPLLARDPAWVAGQLERRLHRPVAIAAMEGRRTGSGPLLVLRDVRIGPPAGGAGSPLLIPSAELKLDFGGWLWPSRHVLGLRVRGLQLDVSRGRDGRWQVNGVGTGDPAQRQSVSLDHLSMDLQLSDLAIALTDEASDRHYRLAAPQLRLSRRGGDLRVGGVLQRHGVAGALRVAGRFSDDGRQGTLWLGADEVDAKAALDGIDLGGYTAESGHGRLAAWLQWREGRIIQGTARIDLDDVSIGAPGGARARVASWHGVAGLRRIDDGYALRWADSDGGALLATLQQAEGAPRRVAVAARDLQLAPLLPWLALKPGLPATLAHWLGEGRPRGTVKQLALRWDAGAGLRSIALAFQGLGIDATAGLPGIDALQGLLRGDGEAVSLELPAQAATLTLAPALRQPLVLSRLAGTVALWPQDGQWHVATDALDFVGAGYAGQARGEMVTVAGAPPFVDLYAVVDHADVTATPLFLPAGLGALDWLDRAFVAGTVDEGRVVLRGHLADWPFRHNEGRFEALARISGLTLDYGRDWPQAKDVAVTARFINNGLLAEASGGQSLGVKADKATAVIPDFGEGLLDLNVSGHGAAADMLAFARQSPIARAEADTLGKMKLTGNGAFDFHLALPLKDAGELSLSGNARLRGVDLDAPEWQLALGGLDGPLQFDAHGMQAGPLAGTFRGQPASVQLALAAATRDPAVLLSARLDGRYRMSELVSGYPSLDWLGKAADGRSDYAIGFTLADADGAQKLTVDSSLEGTTLDLPAPVRKAADSRMPLHVAMALPVDGGQVEIALGDALRARLRLPDEHAGKPLAGTLAFGTVMPDTLPARDLRIQGHAGMLDVTGWVQHAAAGATGDGPGLESVDVAAEQAEWFGQPLGAMRIRATTQPDALSVDVDGAAMLGNFTIPREELAKRGITVRLQRLYWPKVAADASKPPASAPDAPPAAAASIAAPSAGTPAEVATDTGIAPAEVPPLHLWASDLRLGAARLGEARLESWPTDEGMHIDQLRALSSQAQITASGDWNGTASHSQTHMRMEFAAENLGRMLAALGFDGLFEGGKTHDELDASWPGAPSSLALANMRGTLKVNVSDGRIPEVPPGVGRLFGLVSMAELPRRLTLDFGDVFGKGLAFDAITGDFQLADGVATTDNLLIRGPAARISITGRTGLRARDYDQEVTVVPHVGNSLPVVGAVVAGPLGAAAGLAVQGLLGKGLNRAAGARYRITGSWDKPVMTLVEKHEADAPEPALPAPATTVPPPAG